MDYTTLLLEKRDQTLIVTINRPKALNALNNDVIRELDDAVTAFLADDSLSGMLLTGAGEKAFVAGADIAGVNALPGDQAEAFSKVGQNVFAKMEQASKPIIALINGFALGGGCELAMSCHMRIASGNAKFGQPEVNLGLIAGYGGTQRLTRLIGRTKATELLLTGDMIGAEEAHQLGLVNHVVPEDELMEKGLSILAKIYKKSPLAVALTLEAIDAGVQDPAKGWEVEARNFGISVGSDDGREGTAAFLEKRKPVFTGK